MNPTQFLEACLSTSLQACAVIGVTELLARRAAPREQTRLWTAAYVLLLLLSAAAVSLPHIRWTTGVAGTVGVLSRAELEQVLGRYLFTMWTFGCATSLVLLATRMALTTRFLATCSPIPDLTVRGLTSEFEAGRVGRAKIRWLCSAQIAGPICWQLHRPCVVLPDHLLSLDPQELRMVLRHEVEHLQTCHPLQLFLQHLVETLLWFHPLVWWASRRSELARETACDDAAATTPNEVVQYLRVMLKIVERTTKATRPLGTALGLARNQSLLVQRAERLVARAKCLDPVSSRHDWRRRLLVATGLAAAAIWLPVNSLASPRALWSPWPAWSAELLQTVGVAARDYEVYDRRLELHDLRREREVGLPVDR